jgi:hypothetical protein
MNTLDEPQVRAVLDRLHRAARGDVAFFLRRLPMMLGMLLRHVGPSARGAGDGDQGGLHPHLPRAGPLPLPRRPRGRRTDARRVRHVVRRVHDLRRRRGSRYNGGRYVIGTELEPSKRERALANVAEAGLADVVEVRLGDALETLRDAPEPIDLLLLDGWKELYLPVLQLLEPKLRPGAVVLADNIKTFRRALAPYVAYVQGGAHGFRSVTLPLKDGFEFSVKLG